MNIKSTYDYISGSPDVITAETREVNGLAIPWNMEGKYGKSGRGAHNKLDSGRSVNLWGKDAFQPVCWYDIFRTRKQAETCRKQYFQYENISHWL